MRIRNFVRPGVLVGGVLAVLATAVPSASAHGVTSIAFVGNAALSAGGLDYPCAETVNNITTKTDPAKTIAQLTAPTNLVGTKGDKDCPPHITPTGTVTKTGKWFDIDGNTRTGWFGFKSCIGVAVNGPDKAPKPALQTGVACTIAATFVVTGYCGLSQGNGTGTATLAGNSITYRFVWFDVTGGTLVITGWYFKAGRPSPEGDIYATVRIIPADPLTDSCANKTANNFTIVGEATLTHPKILP